MDTKTFIIAAVIKIALVVFIMLTGVAYTTWLERKVIGRIQNRWGPTRVGPFGLLQPLADGIKFILKEDLLPDYVHKGLFILAPMLALVRHSRPKRSTRRMTRCLPPAHSAGTPTL